MKAFFVAMLLFILPQNGKSDFMPRSVTIEVKDRKIPLLLSLKPIEKNPKTGAQKVRARLTGDGNLYTFALQFEFEVQTGNEVQFERIPISNIEGTAWVGGSFWEIDLSDPKHATPRLLGDPNLIREFLESLGEKSAYVTERVVFTEKELDQLEHHEGQLKERFSKIELFAANFMALFLWATIESMQGLHLATYDHQSMKQLLASSLVGLAALRVVYRYSGWIRNAQSRLALYTIPTMVAVGAMEASFLACQTFLTPTGGPHGN